MIGLIVILAVLLIILWSKVNEHSAELRLLEKKIADLSNRILELRGKPAAPPEAVATAPPPVPRPPAAEKAVVREAVQKPEQAIKPFEPSGPEPKPAPAPPPPQIPLSPSPTPEPASPSVFRTLEWKLPQFDWESLVGVKLFSWVAGIALLLAVVFFLRYSINQGWLMPKVRMTIGILIGVGLLVLCEIKAARKYPVTANALDASAIAILFSTFYAARALWDLIGSVPAFVLMVLVTAIAVLLSIRRDSAFIALLGLLGGFATPALLSTGENRPISLFTYLLLLNAGLGFVAAKKKWPLLTSFSMVFTVLYQWGWVVKFLDESQLPIALGIFLVFPVLACVLPAVRRKEEKEWKSLYGQTSNVTASLPLLFTLYLAAVPGYGQHYILLFGFLFLLDAGLFVIAAARGPEFLHTIGALSTLAVSAIWLGMSYQGDAWPAILAFIALFVFFYLSTPLIAAHFGRNFSEAAKPAVYAAPLLLFFFPALSAIEPACAAPGPLFGILFLLMLGISGYAVYTEENLVFLIASLFTLVAEAIWSLRHMTAARLIPGLAIYAVFGLLFIGVPLLAQRLGKRMRPAEAAPGLLLLSIALLAFLAAGPVAAAGIWGLAFLLLILNAGLFWHGAASKRPLFVLAGIVLSLIVLAMLWASVPLDEILIPALIVMAGFVLFILAGSIWMQKQTAGTSLPASSLFLGLAGHLFLAVVALKSDLSIPPWPFLCVLLILDLGVGLSSLCLRRNNLHQGAMTASAVLLMLWVLTARVAPWPTVAILSAGALAAFGIAWIYLARRTGTDAIPFARTAAVTVILAQMTAIIASTQPGVPRVEFLLAAHMAFVVALLGLAWFYQDHRYAVFAVFPSALAVFAWRLQHAGPGFWQQELLFAAPIYLAFVAYPLLLGRRAGRTVGPYLAAVLAGVPFFFLARDAMMQAGWENVIGILPVVQAGLMGLLVLRLLAIEPPGKRTLGRLALAAGAALAFITVAVPLQLENEWITIGWALEAAALSWLYRKIPHKGLLYAAAGLFAAVFARLALNPFVLNYEQRSGIRIWNWYLYAYMVSATTMIAGARLLAKTRDELVPGFPRLSKLTPGAAIILIFLLLNIEIADYFSTGPDITFNFSATLAQDLTYTLTWAIFAVALLAIGIIMRNQAARIASLALLVVTIFKCFIHDLSRLGELYRVMSFAGLGICLVLVTIALQKFVFAARKQNR
jgi:hypothetical protein